MFKLARRLIGIAVLAALVFLALSLWQGGKPFRWFGQKSEEAGEVIKKKSEELGEEAEKIKRKTEDMKETTKKLGEGMRKTGEKLEYITGTKTEK